MKFLDRLRSRWMRYSERPAPSVSPENYRQTANRIVAEHVNNPQLARLIAELTAFNAEVRTEAEAFGKATGTLAREQHHGHMRHPADIQSDPLYREKLAKAEARIEAKDRARTNPIEDIHAEVARRLADFEPPDDASHEEVNAMVEALLEGLPVRVGGVIRKGDPAYDDVVDMAQDSQSHGFSGPTFADPDDMRWPDWQKWMKAVNAPPGWAPCRFGARWGDDTVGQMFGVVRGDFGVYERPFYVCAPVHDQQRLAPLIHLPTGTGVAVFMSPAMAVEAGELAMALGGIDWRTSIDPTNPDTWADIRHRLGAAWNAAGLHLAPFHAHDDTQEDEIAVWMSTHQSRTVGKPAKGKLS